MSTSCFLVGVGGSGSRCLEAGIHLASAGLAPPSLWMGQVDPDNANGNVNRTHSLLQHYVRLRETLRRDPGHTLPSGSHLFKTDITVAHPHFTWSPVASAPNIHTLFKRALMNASESSIFDVLFSRSQEQFMDLTVGFRGRPAVGSTVLAAAARPTDPFWSSLMAARTALLDGGNVRIFLVGSIFGGTGAGGLPTLARMLRHQLSNRNVEGRLHIGAALLLPYFTFPEPGEADRELAAKSAAFLEQSRGALRYYHHLLEGAGNPFDELTVLGWPELIRLRNYAIGRGEQANPPLAPELLAAVAAMRFFHTPPTVRGVSMLGVDDSKGLRWDTIPKVGVPVEQPEVKQALGQLARFAFLIDQVYCQQVGRDHWRVVAGQTWFRRLVTAAGVDASEDKINRVLEHLANYAEMFLRWIGTLQHMSSTSSLSLKLFNIGAMMSTDLERDGLLKLSRTEIDMQRIFADLVQEAERTLSMPEILEELATGPIHREATGLGRLVNALHHACRFQPATPLSRRG